MDIYSRDNTTMTLSTVDDWESRTLEIVSNLQRAIQLQSKAIRHHLNGVAVLVECAGDVADHEKIARLTGALIEAQSRAAASEAELDSIRTIVGLV